MEELKKKVENQIKNELNKYAKTVDENIDAIKKTIDNNNHIMNESSDKRNKEVKTLLDEKVSKAENDFKINFGEISAKIRAFENDLQNLKNYISENDKF